MSITAKVAKRFEGALGMFSEGVVGSLTRIFLSPLMTASTSPNKRPSTSHYIAIRSDKKQSLFSTYYQAQLASISRKKIADLPNRKFSGIGMLILAILAWPFIAAANAVGLALSLFFLAVTTVVAAVTLSVTGAIDGVKALDKKVKANAKAKKAQGMQDNPLYEAAMPKDSPLFQPYGEYVAPAAKATKRPKVQKAPKAKKGTTFNLFGKLGSKKAKQPKVAFVVQQPVRTQPVYAQPQPVYDAVYAQPQPVYDGLFVGADAPSMPVSVAAAGDGSEVSETRMSF